MTGPRGRCGAGSTRAGSMRADPVSRHVTSRQGKIARILGTEDKTLAQKEHQATAQKGPTFVFFCFVLFSYVGIRPSRSESPSKGFWILPW